MQAPGKIRHAGCGKRPEPPAGARAVRVVRTFWKGYESATPPSQPQRTVDVTLYSLTQAERLLVRRRPLALSRTVLLPR